MAQTQAKKNKPTEGKGSPSLPPPPTSASELAYEVDTDQSPELWGHGVSKGANGWIAYKLSNHGEVKLLPPTRDGKVGESQTAATARMLDAQRAELRLMVGR